MRWTIFKVDDDDAPEVRVVGPMTTEEGVRVVSASYTDEDVERVAEAMSQRDNETLSKNDPAAPSPCFPELARAALDAYLET